MIVFFFKGDGDHRDLHVLTHSFPTRRSSDLAADLSDPHALALSRHDAYSRASAPAVSRRPRMSLTFLPRRSEEHTSELQSLMRISYAVFCLKKKNTSYNNTTNTTT